MLAETGLVGLALLLALPFAAVVAVARGWRALPPAARRPASALLAAAAVLLGQSTVDWLWQIPAMAGLGLTCLALGVAVAGAPEVADPPPRGRLPLRVAGVVVPLLAALLIGAIYLSDLNARLARADRDELPAVAARRRPQRAAPQPVRAARRATSRRARWSRSAAGPPPAASCSRRSTASRRTS